MAKLLALSLNDFKNIFRERMLYFMFVGAPILMFLVATFGFPWFAMQFPALEPHMPLILVLMVYNVVGGIGFVIASIILDERDEDLLTVLQVTPISTNFFIGYRLIFSVLISFFFALIMFQLTSVITFSFMEAVGASFLLSLVTPIIVLALSAFSGNKVEGLAVYKGLNLILLLPAISFFLSAKFQFLFWVIPVYWSFRWVLEVAGGSAVPLIFVVAVVSNFGVILGLVGVFRGRVF